MDEAAFEGERPHLRALAYRMLGSQAEAEDVLQDAWLRWRDVTDAQSPRAYLTAMVTRLCVDQLKSARARREVYVGPWLPEPVRTTVDEKPDRESISLAFLRIMERLGPVERAVFLLHQVFDYGHAEVARIVDKDEAAVRQILHRARERMRAERPRFAANREAHERLLTGFLAACAAGDVAAVESLLARDAVLRTDAGGKARAARREVMGANEVARFFVGIGRKGAYEGRTLEAVELNGWPAALVRWQGAIELAVAIETDGHHIFAVNITSNPDKLQRLG
jgi:RNA polymerase sigma-70 factor (ECF subfamily)